MRTIRRYWFGMAVAALGFAEMVLVAVASTACWMKSSDEPSLMTLGTKLTGWPGVRIFLRDWAGSCSESVLQPWFLKGMSAVLIGAVVCWAQHTFLFRYRDEVEKRAKFERDVRNEIDRQNGRGGGRGGRR